LEVIAKTDFSGSFFSGNWSMAALTTESKLSVAIMGGVLSGVRFIAGRGYALH
jgi:hypothetical protein